MPSGRPVVAVPPKASTDQVGIVEEPLELASDHLTSFSFYQGHSLLCPITYRLNHTSTFESEFTEIHHAPKYLSCPFNYKLILGSSQVTRTFPFIVVHFVFDLFIGLSFPYEHIRGPLLTITCHQVQWPVVIFNSIKCKGTTCFI